MPLVTNTSLAGLGALIQAHQRFAICSHIRPDGDAIGSTVALGLALKAAGKDVTLLNEDGTPASLGYLPGSEGVLRQQGNSVALEGIEVAFALDTATHVRVGDGVLAAIAKAGKLVNIDHHISNPGYGDHFYIDSESPATGQIIFQLLQAANLPISKDIAENIYTAISTDTGSFQYPSTTADTYRIAGQLIEAGVDVGSLNQKIYQSQPLRRLRLLGELLNVLKLSADGRCASWHLSLEMANRAGSIPDDTENLIDHIRAIDGVIVAAFFEEMTDGKIRISLRSKDARVNVSALAGNFGGGGHAAAAGARMAGPIESAQEKVLTKIHEALAAI